MLRRRKRDDDAEVETNLIPVLSCLFLLIPALLLAMEVAPFSAIYVSPPKFCEVPIVDDHDPDPPERLHLRVTVRQDGFVARYGSTDESERTVDIPMGPDGEHDFAELESRARELKELFPDDFQVTLSAENSVEYRTLVQSMDALRGRQCSLAGAMHGEREPTDCYFWNVIVQSGAV